MCEQRYSQAGGSLVLLERGGPPQKVSAEKGPGLDWEGFEYHVRSLSIIQRTEKRSRGKVCKTESSGCHFVFLQWYRLPTLVCEHCGCLQRSREEVKEKEEMDGQRSSFRI